MGEEVWRKNDLVGIGRSIGLFKRIIGRGVNTYTIDVFVAGGTAVGPYGQTQTIKYFDDGTQSWVRYFNPSPSGNTFNSLVIDESENVYCAGTASYSGTFKDYIIVKYSFDGLQLWDNNYRNNYVNVGLKVILDAFGNLYLTGSSQDPISNYDYLTAHFLTSYGDNFSFQNTNIANEYKLDNYPNPFNPSTKISFTIPQNGIVSLKVYNLIGKETIELINEYKKAGTYDVIFDGSSLASGIYFYRLVTSDYSNTKKMILIK